jgi:hypothetical protein
VMDQHIARIVDYAHCKWVLSAATSVVMADPCEMHTAHTATQINMGCIVGLRAGD